MKPRRFKLAAYLIVPYLCFFLLLSAAAMLQPSYTWDLVGYIGSSIDSTDAKVIHRATFEAIRPIASNKNIQLENPYRIDVASNPFHFAEQLPFYSIKPVYVVLMKELHHLGLPFPRAAVFISAASNFVLAILLWYWLSPYLSGLPLLAASSLIMLSPNILELSRWAAPDCLATLIAAVGLYMILERSRYFWGCSLLVLDVWVRTDALVLAGIILFVLFLRRRLDFYQFATLSFLALGSYFAINHFAGSYGWPALFYNSFSGGLIAPGETIVHISLRAYLHQIVLGMYLWLVTAGFALYILLGALAIWMNRTSLYAYIVAAVLASRVVSYVLYPNGDQRYTAVLFVVVLVALVVAVRLRTGPQTVIAQEHDNLDSVPVAVSVAP
jgi:hypothetical protein